MLFRKDNSEHLTDEDLLYSRPTALGDVTLLASR